MRFRQNFAVVTAGSPLYVQQIVNRSSAAETRVFRLFYKKFCRNGGEVSPVFRAISQPALQAARNVHWPRFAALPTRVWAR